MARRDPRLGAEYLKYRMGYVDPNWSPQFRQQLDQQFTEDRAANAIMRFENNPGVRHMTAEAKTWMAEYLNSNKSGMPKAFQQANLDAALQKAYQAWLGQRTTELMDREYSADTKAHREHMKCQQRLAAGVLNQLGQRR